MKRFKAIFAIIVVSLITTYVYAQSYNTENVAWTNYLVRLYENEPFEGVRVVDDYTSTHLIYVLTLDAEKYSDESTLNRVASVKAMSQASRFFNGSTITDELIIKTSEKSDGSSNTEIIENIKEHSIGYVKSLQLLTNFKGKDNRRVFIFSTPLKNEKKT